MVHTRAKISQKSSGSKDKVENKLTNTTNFITFNQLPTELLLKLYRQQHCSSANLNLSLYGRKQQQFNNNV